MPVEELVPGGGARGVVSSLDGGEATSGSVIWVGACSTGGLATTDAARAISAAVPLVSAGSGCSTVGTGSGIVGVSPKAGCGITPEGGVCGSEDLSRLNRDDITAGDRLEGTVLLRWTADPVVGVARGLLNNGVAGLGAATDADFFDCFEETETFLLTPPNLRRLSAPAELAVDPDLSMPEMTLDVVGDFPCGVGGPLCTSCTVFSSAAVPCIPMRK